MQVLVALVMLALAGSTLRALAVGNQNLASAGTVFAGIFVQAIPFLALGVVDSGLVAAFVSADRVGRGGVDGCAAALEAVAATTFPDETWVSVEGMVPSGRATAPDGRPDTERVAYLVCSSVRESVRGLGLSPRRTPPNSVRLKLGRPDLRDYAGYFDVPAAAPDSPLTVTWAGVTTLLIDDGSSALMTDGFFSRPGLASVGLRRISPSLPRIDGCLARLGVDRLEAVLPVHTHYDHAMDSAVVAERTGARVVGGTSAAQVGRGHGLPEDRLVVATSGEPDHARGVRRHAGGVRTLSARPLSGCDHRPGRPAGQGIGLQVRRGVVDAGASPGHRIVGC